MHLMYRNMFWFYFIYIDAYLTFLFRCALTRLVIIMLKNIYSWGMPYSIASELFGTKIVISKITTIQFKHWRVNLCIRKVRTFDIRQRVNPSKTPIPKYLHKYSYCCTFEHTHVPHHWFTRATSILYTLFDSAWRVWTRGNHVSQRDRFWSTMVLIYEGIAGDEWTTWGLGLDAVARGSKLKSTRDNERNKFYFVFHFRPFARFLWRSGVFIYIMVVGLLYIYLINFKNYRVKCIQQALSKLVNTL